MSNFQPVLPEDELTRAGGTLPSVIKAASKTELLSRAKAAIEAGRQSFHDAAEALAVAQELHGASQAEMARAVGKSEAWVSLLLQWRRSNYKDESPFGPRTKAGRLKHAKDRAASGASKPRKPRKPTAAAAAHAGTGASNSSGEENHTSESCGDDANALAEFKDAVDRCLARMSYEAKCEAVSYVLERSGVRGS